MALRRELEHLRRPLEASWEEALNAAFEAGDAHGVARERKRIRQALRDTDAEPADAAEVPAVVKAAHHGASSGYGMVASAVRSALIDLGPVYDNGIGPAELTDYCRNELNAPVTKGQVLTALKQMAGATRQEAIRVSRGRYRPGPNLRAGNTGGDAPASQAAE